jgi:hypothetical protein
MFHLAHMKLSSPQEEDYFNEILAEPNIDVYEFLQRWFSVENSKFGDGKRCNLVMVRIFEVSPSAVRNWGAAPTYLSMPIRHRRYLTYLHRRMLERYS